MKSQMLGLLLALSFAAHGQTGRPIESLRDVELGMSVSEVAECPRDPDGPLGRYLSDSDPRLPTGAKGTPCVSKGDPFFLSRGYKFFQLVRLPHIDGLGTQVGIEVLEGKVQEIEIVTLPSNYDPILEALISKYGRPTSSTTKTFRNGLGQELSGRTAMWVAPNALLQIEEHRNGKPDNAYVTLTSNAYIQALQDRRKQTANELKSKL